MAKALGNLEIIPSGEAMQELKGAVGTVHRDSFHASYGMGRYTLALTWLETLTGASAIGNSFRDFDEPVTEEQAQLCQRSAHAAVEKTKA